MSSDDLFAIEKQILQKIEDTYTKPEHQDNPLLQSIKEFGEQYRRLLRQNKKLVNVSDTLERKLIETNQQKNKFLGLVVHDLRNPLTIISGFSQALLDTKEISEEKRLACVKRIYSTCEEMISLVNDLLDMSAIENGELKLNPHPSSLQKMIEERIILNTYNAERKKINIQTEYDDIPDCPFDSNRLSQAFDNLLGNAIKFSPFESTINVSLIKVNDMARISIKDEGQGIPEEEQKYLFGAFNRLSTKPTGGERSTGLGLAIVKKIVESHSGIIEVDSKPGAGSTFSIKLPIPY